MAEDSDNEDIEDDVNFALDEEDVLEAVQTHIKGSQRARRGKHDQDEELDADKAVGSKLHDMTKHMFRLSASIWLEPTKGAQREDAHVTILMEDADAVVDHALAKKASQASRNQAAIENQQSLGLLGVNADDASVRGQAPLTAATLRNWLYSHHVSDNTNKEQHELLKLVVDRLLVELELAPIEETALQNAEPMCHLLHGPPGTGKSHCLIFLRELFDLIGYRQGIDYEVLAFQAVNAASLAGKTIHHACGFRTEQHSSGDAAAIAATTAKRLSYWRWVFLDEISMVGAQLLGRMDHRIRSIKSDADKFKFDGQGQPRQGSIRHGTSPVLLQARGADIVSRWKRFRTYGTIYATEKVLRRVLEFNPETIRRPFGGVNIIMGGDFFQLPPPEGGFLGSIPQHLRGQDAPQPDARKDSGLSILWESTQGVTELHQRERCKDCKVERAVVFH